MGYDRFAFFLAVPMHLSLIRCFKVVLKNLLRSGVDAVSDNNTSKEAISNISRFLSISQ